MDQDEFELMVRRERLEPLLPRYADELREAAAHVADLRGALDKVVELRTDMSMRFTPPVPGDK